MTDSSKDDRRSREKGTQEIRRSGVSQSERSVTGGDPTIGATSLNITSYLGALLLTSYLVGGTTSNPQVVLSPKAPLCVLGVAREVA